jgi:hypothetical protein
MELDPRIKGFATTVSACRVLLSYFFITLSGALGSPRVVSILAGVIDHAWANRIHDTVTIKIVG